jgi:hypothetical protein
MNPTTTTGAERVRDALLDLCEPLHRAFAAAEAISRERLPELAEDPVYRWHTTHTIRAYAHHALSRSDLGSWTLSGNHAHNGELWLTDGTYRVRVLHALSDGDVPTDPAGHAYYRTIALPVATPLFGPPDDRLLILWRFDGAPRFRVVRPVGDWRWGGQAQTDLDFVLPATAAELAAVRFEVSPVCLPMHIPDEDGSTASSPDVRVTQ